MARLSKESKGQGTVFQAESGEQRATCLERKVMFQEDTLNLC